MSKQQLLEYWNPVSEVCGVITCEGEIVELKNHHPNPELGFRMRRSDFPDVPLMATWHTHPGGSANLSSTDYFLFLQNPELTHLIVGHGIVWEYYVRDNKVFRNVQTDTI